MTTDIKPIETHYAGCRFRSRLEARWAVFFDTHGIKWEYEAQGFDLPIVGRYLPDFWLPEWKAFVEIKGALEREEQRKEERKLAMLSLVSSNQVFLFQGNIGEELIELWSLPRRVCYCWWWQCGLCSRTWLHEFPQECPLWCSDCLEHFDVSDHNRDKIYTAARSARFEFGETPIPKRLRERAGRR